MGSYALTLMPQSCRDCPFFEIIQSSLGVSFFCRFYKKGALSLNHKKFDFCKVEKIEIYESKSNDDLN